MIFFMDHMQDHHLGLYSRLWEYSLLLSYQIQFQQESKYEGYYNISSETWYSKNHFNWLCKEI